MRATRFALLALSLVFLASGCSEHKVDASHENYVDGRVIGTIHGVVVDAINNARLPDVVVTAAIDGKIVTTKTNSEGYYVFDKLDSGYYTVTFHFPGSKDVADAYAVGRTYVWIPTLDDIYMDEQPSSRDFHYSDYYDMYLYPMTAAYSGRVFKQVDNESLAPASGVTVVADFGGYDLSVDKYETTTDANGNYALEGLPAAGTIYSRAMPHNDGTHNFGQQAVEVGLVHASEVFAPNIVVGVTGIAPLIIQNNFANGDFGLDDDLEIVFSEPMLAESFTIDLRHVAANRVVLFAEEWSADGLELTLDPYVSLLPNALYRLSMTGQSQSRVNFSRTIDFRTIDGIQLVSTNLQTIDGVSIDFPVGQAIELTYSLPVDLTRSTVELRRTNAGGTIIAAAVTLTNSNQTVSIAPLSPLLPGTVYWLGATIASTLPGDILGAQSWTFTTAAALPVPGQVTGFRFNDPDFEVNFNTTTGFTFFWNTVADAGTYEIWGRWNNAKETRLLGSVTADPAATFQTGSVNLPSDWDYYTGGIVTPFVEGSTVTFVATARNNSGRGALSSAVEIGDTIAPTGTIGAQVGGSGNNNTTSPREITLPFNATNGEYLNRAVPPVIVLTNPQGTTTSFAWNAGGNGGTITLLIPANTNIVGSTLELRAFEDSSGNEVDPGSYPSRVIN